MPRGNKLILYSTQKYILYENETLVKSSLRRFYEFSTQPKKLVFICFRGFLSDLKNALMRSKKIKIASMPE